MISDKELKYSYVWCGHKSCRNNRIIKTKMDKRRAILKRDTKKEVKLGLEGT